MSTTLPTSQKALYLPAVKQPLVIKDAPVRQPSAGEVLVRNESVALNPIDWKLQASLMPRKLSDFPLILGYDGSGVVVSIGDDVANVKVGDRVFYEGELGGNGENATFQQYTIVPAHLVGKVPSNISFDQAATLPVGLATAAVGLYQDKFELGGAGLLAPWLDGGRGRYTNEPIFIIGGAACTGQAAIMFAKLSGFNPIITTSSPHNFALLKSLGADYTLDRNENLRSVEAYTTLPLYNAFDAVGSAESQTVAQRVLSPGGTLISVHPNSIPHAKQDISKKIVFMWGSVHSSQNKKLATNLFESLYGLLESSDIKPNNVEYAPGGLNAVENQLKRLRRGEVSGKKIIVRPSETV
ncbi:GroES-like protein [Abortiporus biennis]|nr:GroES-like protein [Abortiporus biennis]